MKRVYFVFTFFAMAVALAAQGGGLLWRVSGAGLDRPSYILGSHHLAPISMVDSIPGLRAALAGVDAVYGELDKESLTSPAAQSTMLEWAMAPADSTLQVVLTPAQIVRVDSIFADYMGMPGLAASFSAFKPALLSTQLAMLQNSRVMPELDAASAFDVAFLTLAEQQGKEIGALETLQRQLELLFGDPLAIQASDLMEAIDNNDALVEQARDLYAAYMARDLDALTAVVLDTDSGLDATHSQRLIFDRNHAWSRQLQSIMPGRSILVMVGAGHLGGDEGLLNLLRAAGYTVEPVE